MKQILASILIMMSMAFSQVQAEEANEPAPVVRALKFLDDTGTDISSEEMSGMIETKIGEPLNSTNLLIDVNVLHRKFSQYKNISTKIDPVDNNEVSVTFEFQRRRMVERVSIDIKEDIEEPTGLQDKITIFKGAVFNSRKLESDKLSLKDIFVGMGYPKANVEHSLEKSRRSGRKDVRVVYNVSVGSKRLLINDIDFHGNKHIRGSRLRDLMNTKTRSWFLASRPKFKLFNLDDDMKTIEEYYQNHGFLDVKASYTYKIKNERYVEIDVSVNEGRLYNVDQVNIYGAEIMDPAQIMMSMDYELGKAYSEKEIRSGLNNVRKFYGKQGYVNTETIVSFDSDNTTLEIFLREGEQFTINDIEIIGHFTMKKEVIQRDIKLRKGDIINTKTLDETLQKMLSTQYYSTVRVDFVPKDKTTGNVVVYIEQGGAHTIRFGGGMGSTGAYGEVAYSNNNLFGTGKSIALHLQKSQEMTKIGLLFKDPHLLGSDYEMNASISYDDREYDAFDKKKLAALVVIEKEIKKNLRLGLGMRVEFLDIDDVKDEINNTVHNAEGKSTVIGLVSTIYYSTVKKDKAGEDRDGYKVRIAMLPSYSEEGAYIKTFARLVAHKSIGEENEHGASHTISGKITLGYASDNAPFHEKFYGGGISTIRGFENRSIGRDSSGVGGEYIAAATLSYSFPVWKDVLKGVVFMEAMTIGDKVSDLGDNIRAVGGLGVRANLRNTFLGSSLEAGFAIPFLKQDGDQTKPFYFIFGDYDPAYDI